MSGIGDNLVIKFGRGVIVTRIDGLRTFFDFDFDFSKLAPRAGILPFFFAKVDFQYASKSNFFSTLKLCFHPNDRKMQTSVCV